MRLLSCLLLLPASCLLLASPHPVPAPAKPVTTAHLRQEPTGAYQAEPFEAALLETRRGAMLYWNGPRHAFSLALDGKVAPTEHENFVRLNGYIVQAAIIPFQQALDFGHLSEAAQKTNLEGYRQYELRYFKQELGQDYRNVKSEWLTLAGQPFLLWSFDEPAANTSIGQQLYLTTICFDQILNLNTPVERKGGSAAAQRKLLTTVAATLKLENAPVDLKALYEQYQREK